MDSSPSKINSQPSLPPISGIKRPAPSLLPAFEPLSSSPALPRPAKRQARHSPSLKDPFLKYPTPVPTSTTGVLSSSPPRLPNPRPGLLRSQAGLTERAPLSAVPTVTLPENGEPLLMGRSSNSSHYQLSANRLISRVHVRARYIAGNPPLENSQVEIVCMGWNGVKVHCHGRTWELAKGDSFTSSTETAEIMLDVQDARVIIAWPIRERSGVSSDDSWDDENSPKSNISAVNARGEPLNSSPLRLSQRLISPESPTPAGPAASTSSLPDLFPDGSNKGTVQVYEDESASEGDGQATSVPLDISLATTEAALEVRDLNTSQSSDLSEPSDDDPDEENDPIIHSFGPFGADISSRMASFKTGDASPNQTRDHVSAASSALSSPAKRSDSESTNDADPLPIVNHVINQLAFSRLSSTPLSSILNNLPAELKTPSPTGSENPGLTKEDLQKYLDAATCIGEIHREGKDAAGKPLESEYYYILEEDHDEGRRAVVEGMRKPTLRNCRKAHKQYYWRKPKTP